MQFHFFRIPVTICPSFWIFALFFSNLLQHPSMHGLILVGVLILSLLVHEFGHAATAARFGASPQIILEAFGGRAQYRGMLSPKQEFLVVLNGPLFECLLIALSYPLLKSNLFIDFPHVQFFLQATLHFNVLWVLLNLLPILPLDGGYLVRYLLIRKWGSQGEASSVLLGLGACAVVAPYLLLQGYLVFGLLLVIFGLQYFQRLRTVSFQTDPVEQLKRGKSAIEQGQLPHAKKIFKKLTTSSTPSVQQIALEHLAHVYVLENDRETAYELLVKAKGALSSHSKCVLAHLAFEKRNYLLIAELSRELYEIEPTYETALLNAKSFALLEQPAHAGAWLATAVKFEDRQDTLEDLLQDPAFATVKLMDRFKDALNATAALVTHADAP